MRLLVVLIPAPPFIHPSFLLCLHCPWGACLSAQLYASQFVVCDSPAGRLGLTVCYDLRFPEVYQTLTWTMGAKVLLVPSAFTKVTGLEKGGLAGFLTWLLLCKHMDGIWREHMGRRMSIQLPAAMLSPWRLVYSLLLLCRPGSAHTCVFLSVCLQVLHTGSCC